MKLALTLVLTLLFLALESVAAKYVGLGVARIDVTVAIVAFLSLRAGLLCHTPSETIANGRAVASKSSSATVHSLTHRPSRVTRPLSHRPPTTYQSHLLFGL